MKTRLKVGWMTMKRNTDFSQYSTPIDRRHLWSFPTHRVSHNTFIWINITLGKWLNWPTITLTTHTHLSHSFKSSFGKRNQINVLFECVLCTLIERKYWFLPGKSIFIRQYIKFDHVLYVHNVYDNNSLHTWQKMPFPPIFTNVHVFMYNLQIAWGW